MPGSRPGERRGGRKKGTPNKLTIEVIEKLASLKCDPIEGMARLAMNPKCSPELRGKMYSELAQYIAPKRKAIEHTGLDGGAVSIALIDRILAGAERASQGGETQAKESTDT